MVAIVLGVALSLVIFTAMAFLRSNPPTVDFATGHPSGQAVNIELQTVGTYGSGIHPSWVSYLTRDPQGKWVHTTLWDVPAHTRINMTIYQYDSGSPLRNQEFGQVAGTTGNSMTVNGKLLSVIDSNVGNGVAHTFTIPTLGISVPLYGNSGTANLCSAAPCTAKSPHNVIKFSFMSPGVGQYPWQCFVPCGLGYLYGNGGPMQTIGYMDGFMKVVA
ncbi:MAG: hypothetical protein ACYCSF_12905 [Acidimicrobiales bacterium]